MLLKHTLLYLPAQFLGPLSQFAALLLWTHFADGRTVGAVTLITATQELLSATLLGFWSQYVLRHMGGLVQAGHGAALRSTATYVLAASAALQSTIALLILSRFIVPDAGTGLRSAVVLLAVSRTVNLYLSERARVREDVWQFSTQNLTGPILGLAIGLVLLHRYGSDPFWPILGFAAAQTGAALVGMVRDRDWIGLGAPRIGIVSSALAYGGAILITGAFGWLAINSSRFLVDEMLGLEAAGAYSVGFGLGFRATTVAALAVTAAAFPLAVKRMDAGDRAGAFGQLAANGALLFGVVAPSTLGLWLVSPSLVRSLIAAPFWAATLETLPWALLAGAAYNIRAHFVQQAFLLDRRTTPMIVLSGLEALASAGCGFVLIGRYGLTGGAMGLAAATTAGLSAASFVAARRGLRFPWADLAKIGVGLGALALGVLAIPASDAALVLVEKILAGAGAYLLTMLLLYSPQVLALEGVRRRLARYGLRRRAYEL